MIGNNTIKRGIAGVLNLFVFGTFSLMMVSAFEIPPMLAGAMYAAAAFTAVETVDFQFPKRG